VIQSGCVKLLSGDPTWRNLTALTFHYETQPLPTWIGWYAHQLPLWAQKASAGMMFGIELFVPFLIFAPRRLRQFACALLVFLQALICLTGNYCFFNLLTVALCLLLLDDAALEALLPAKIRKLVSCVPQPAALKPRRWPAQLTVPLACIAIGTSLLQFSFLCRVPVPWPRPVVALYAWLEPFRSFNSYGLFAFMTTSRSEIVIEGSSDGVTWRAYEFRYKPGDIKRRPKFVAPNQPRLDWQMWFAALGTYRNNPWLVNLCVRLLRGAPPVLALFERNPFPAGPPRYVRAVLYTYRFTSFTERRESRAWWRRQEKRTYLPALSLSGMQSPQRRRESAPPPSRGSSPAIPRASVPAVRQPFAGSPEPVDRLPLDVELGGFPSRIAALQFHHRIAPAGELGTSLRCQMAGL